MDQSSEAPGFHKLLAAFDGGDHHPPLTASNVSELIFTSGTEAEPKAVMHTEQTTNFAVRTAWSSLSMNHSDVVWMPSPIGHSTGFNYGVRMALYHGLKLVLQDRWDGATAVALIESESCTYTLAATTFLRDLARRLPSEITICPSMRLFGCGGAPVPPTSCGQQPATASASSDCMDPRRCWWARGTDPDRRRRRRSAPMASA